MPVPTLAAASLTQPLKDVQVHRLNPNHSNRSSRRYLSPLWFPSTDFIATQEILTDLRPLKKRNHT